MAVAWRCGGIVTYMRRAHFLQASADHTSYLCYSHDRLWLDSLSMLLCVDVPRWITARQVVVPFERHQRPKPKQQQQSRERRERSEPAGQCRESPRGAGGPDPLLRDSAVGRGLTVGGAVPRAAFPGGRG
eukprot:3919933-Pyramimonas_sp.AAC.1